MFCKETISRVFSLFVTFETDNLLPEQPCARDTKAVFRMFDLFLVSSF